MKKEALKVKGKEVNGKVEKETMLDTLKVSNLPELKGWKKKQDDLVKNNPFIICEDAKTYKTACERRTNLLKGRTELDKQDKLVASKLASYRKEIKSETEFLIAIALPTEEKQQAEIKRYESIKEQEKKDAEIAEELRVNTIKNKDDELEAAAYEFVKLMTFDGLELLKDQVLEIESTDFDFEEFDVLHERAVLRIRNVVSDKIAELKEKEAERVEALRIKAVADQNAKDLKELQDKTKKEAKDRKEKELAEKAQMFSIRSNRLAEIGFIYNGVDFFEFKIDGNDTPIPNAAIEALLINDADAVNFEDRLKNARLLITDIKNKIEESNKKEIVVPVSKSEIKVIDDILVENKTELLTDFEIEKADTIEVIDAVYESEDKFAVDKMVLTEFIDDLGFHLMPDLDNKESVELLESFSLKLVEFKKGLYQLINSL